MEREVPFFCRDAVVSYRIADVAELERETSFTFLFRFASLRFPLLRFASFRFVSLRVASLCFVLLRFAPLCFALLHFASWERSGIVLGFRFVLVCFASLCFALVCFVSLCFVSFCLVLLGLRFVLLRFAPLCFALLLGSGLGAFWERSGSVLEAFWERLGSYFRRSGGKKNLKIEAACAHAGFISKKLKI